MKNNESKNLNRTNHVLGGRSLESRVEELYFTGKSESEIAKELKVSTRYVHGVLKGLGIID